MQGPTVGQHATNIYDVLMSLITLVLVPLVTAWITKEQLKRQLVPKVEEVRKEAVAAKVAAVSAVQETVVGNQQLGEVQRAVNGDKDRLVAKVSELEAKNNSLESQLAGRRAGENR